MRQSPLLHLFAVREARYIAQPASFSIAIALSLALCIAACESETASRDRDAFRQLITKRIIARMLVRGSGRRTDQARSKVRPIAAEHAMLVQDGQADR